MVVMVYPMKNIPCRPCMKITSARIGEPGGGSARTFSVTHFSGPESMDSNEGGCLVSGVTILIRSVSSVIRLSGIDLRNFIIFRRGSILCTTVCK